jgi:hypothetical protein
MPDGYLPLADPDGAPESLAEPTFRSGILHALFHFNSQTWKNKSCEAMF